MALIIQWTSLALEDLLSIREYIQKDKPLAAKETAARIKKTVERLSRFPKSGRILKTIPQIREVIFGNYRIFYRIRKNHVEIFRIYHGKREIP